MESNSTSAPQKCSACGANIPLGASRCVNCGEEIPKRSELGQDPPRTATAASGNEAFSRKSRESTTAGPDISIARGLPGAGYSSSTAEKPASRTVTLHGTVNRFQSRSPSGPQGSLDIWTFVLEVTNADQRTSSILVQAGPDYLRGSLHNGEQVRVTGKFEEGVFHAHRIYSKSTAAFVGPNPKKRSIQIIAATIILPVVLAIGLYLGSTQWREALEQGRKNSQQRQEQMQRELEQLERSIQKRNRAFQEEFERQRSTINQRKMTQEQRASEIEQRRREYEQRVQELRQEFEREKRRLLQR